MKIRTGFLVGQGAFHYYDEADNSLCGKWRIGGGYMFIREVDIDVELNKPASTICRKCLKKLMMIANEG